MRPAVIGDRSEASDELVTARRLVYRVGFVVPPGFRGRRSPVNPSAAELEVDLSRDRLRARFVGPGWPVEHGSEVRLRADVPGVYLFDGDGGRSLGPGELASWFEGRASGSRSRVRVRRESAKRTAGPSEPICLLLAEWTAQAREDIARRCSGGSIPPGFAFGPWRGELTAMVPLQLPRSALRADHVDGPDPIARARHGLALGREALARIEPSKRSVSVASNASRRAMLVWVNAAGLITIKPTPRRWAS